MVRVATSLAALAGLALFLFLLFRFGAGEIAAATVAAGWGLVAVVLYRFVNLAADTLGWRALFSGPARPRFVPLLVYRWVGEAINSLLPVAQVGGDVWRARLLLRQGVSAPEAGATVVVDFTAGLVTQVIYTALGVGLLVSAKGFGAEARGIVLGVAVAAVLLAALLAVQRLGVFGPLARMARRMWTRAPADSFTVGAAELDRRITALYSDRDALMRCAGWRMASWLLHTGETWLALWFLGLPVSFAEALILESLGTAVRSAAFAVPGGLGVQEGGFLLLGALLGLPPEAALALALVKRVRELAVGGPGLVAWAGAEGRSLARLLFR
jgi:putative membrane protein